MLLKIQIRNRILVRDKTRSAVHHLSLSKSRFFNIFLGSLLLAHTSAFLFFFTESESDSLWFFSLFLLFASLIHFFECFFSCFFGEPDRLLFPPRFAHPERGVPGVVDYVNTWGVLHKRFLLLVVPATVAEQVQNHTKDKLSLCLSLSLDLGLSEIGRQFWFGILTLSVLS